MKHLVVAGAQPLNHLNLSTEALPSQTSTIPRIPLTQLEGAVISGYMGMGQNLVPLVNIKIAGKWMFIPLKMVLIGIDPYPYNHSFTVGLIYQLARLITVVVRIGVGRVSSAAGVEIAGRTHPRRSVALMWGMRTSGHSQ